ncbi:MAG: hypothetical protein EOM69_13120, partial [Clostridia bacterium]|nr:hypothetical protein [Clostridia bacterium]
MKEQVYMPIERTAVMPAYVADVQNAYVQSLSGTYFGGQSREMECCASKKAYVVLHNPCESGVNLFINRVLLANLSATPLRMNEHFCVRCVDGEICHCHCVASCNMRSCERERCNRCEYGPRACLLCGENLSVSGGCQTLTATAQAYETYTEQTHGSIVLTPGCYFVVEVTALEAATTGSCEVT